VSSGHRASRPVYSTGPSGTRELCPRCGWPKKECRCSTSFDEEVPEKIVARLRIEKSGRGGKTVTVIDGLPRNAALLAALASELKKALGTGGSALESSVEIQGDRRDAIRARLAARGWTVKG
jgi:translation initiation factor 1